MCLIITWCHLLSWKVGCRGSPLVAALYRSYQIFILIFFRIHTMILSVHAAIPRLFYFPQFPPICPFVFFLSGVVPKNVSLCFRVLLKTCFLFPARFKTSMFVTCQVQLMSCIILRHHISNASHMYARTVISSSDAGDRNHSTKTTTSGSLADTISALTCGDIAITMLDPPMQTWIWTLIEFRLNQCGERRKRRRGGLVSWR